MSANGAVQMAEAKLNKTLASIKEKVPEDRVQDIEEREIKVFKSFHNDIVSPINQEIPQNGSNNILSEVDTLVIPFMESNNKQIEAEIKKLRSEDLEPIFRKSQLIYPKSETEFIKSLWWFSQQGTSADLEILESVKLKDSYNSEQIMFIIEQVQSQIFKRETKNLMSFFDIDSTKLRMIVDKMIQNEKTATFAALPEAFVPDVPSQALHQLEITRDKIKSLIISEKINDWLATPQRVLVDKTPKEAIEEGKVYRVLQMLMRLEEGSH